MKTLKTTLRLEQLDERALPDGTPSYPTIPSYPNSSAPNQLTHTYLHSNFLHNQSVSDHSHPVKLSAGIYGTSTSTNATITGFVIFYDGETVVSSVPVFSGSVADVSINFTINDIGVGLHILKAAYQGDGNYAPSVSDVSEVELGIGVETTTTTTYNFGYGEGDGGGSDSPTTDGANVPPMYTVGSNMPASSPPAAPSPLAAPVVPTAAPVVPPTGDTLAWKDFREVTTAKYAAFTAGKFVFKRVDEAPVIESVVEKGMTVISCNVKIKSATFTVLFDADASYVVKRKAGGPLIGTPELLEHERLHFKIAEYIVKVAEGMRPEMKGTSTISMRSADKVAALALAMSAAEKSMVFWWNRYGDRVKQANAMTQAHYDYDTVHGTYVPMQTVWNKDYKTYCDGTISVVDLDNLEASGSSWTPGSIWLW